MKVVILITLFLWLVFLLSVAPSLIICCWKLYFLTRTKGFSHSSYIERLTKILLMITFILAVFAACPTQVTLKLGLTRLAATQKNNYCFNKYFTNITLRSMIFKYALSWVVNTSKNCGEFRWCHRIKYLTEIKFKDAK